MNIVPLEWFYEFLKSVNCWWCELYFGPGSCQEAKIPQYCKTNTYKEIVSILSRLSDSE